MSLIPCYEPGSGSPAADRLLAEVATRFGGFVPNLHKIMARSPATLGGFVALHGALGEASLPPLAREVVALEVSRRNGCSYCTAAHSKMALRLGLSPDDLASVRDGREVAGKALSIVQQAAAEIIDAKGRIGAERIEYYRTLGLDQSMLMEIIATIATFTLATFVNNLAGTPIDPAFA